MKIEIVNWLDGPVIFSHDCENNSIKLTLETGVKLGVSFACAILTNADLTNAILTNAIGNKKEIKSMHVTEYKIVWTSKMLFIGCESHTKEQWLSFTDDEIESMDKGALDWWKEWKPKLIALGVFS